MHGVRPDRLPASFGSGFGYTTAVPGSTDCLAFGPTKQKYNRWLARYSNSLYPLDFPHIRWGLGRPNPNSRGVKSPAAIPAQFGPQACSVACPRVAYENYKTLDSRIGRADIRPVPFWPGRLFFISVCWRLLASRVLRTDSRSLVLLQLRLPAGRAGLVLAPLELAMGPFLHPLPSRAPATGRSDRLEFRNQRIRHAGHRSAVAGARGSSTSLVREQPRRWHASQGAPGRHQGMGVHRLQDQPPETLQMLTTG
jgi:hypothetical protein